MFGQKFVYEIDSKYNGHLRVVKTFGLGTYIQSGGLTQTGGVVESIWKSTLKKIRKNDISKILILGLGGGTLAKLLKRIYPLAKITGIEIDPIMIELGNKYFDLSSYDVDVKIMDASKFKIGSYDLIIVDLYNGDKYPEKFETVSFLKSLKKSKLVIFNRLYYGEKKEKAIKFELKLKKVFGRVDLFYPTANIMFFCYNS